ncbi:hypothetical protein A374_06606 [Fictibacillus macauensis ZFHKF-1]|uniref:Uncharacterized protein n=1 Tax=Fictibacillus macauensis ZFHKF-1 TaxID=1196324 RepID=I8AKX6_9BACL|nr:zinc ribbon domain-containing protein [Fictibacillus macauensis]EIT86249.1 hypothetical protein A374_06606 [Fictibacillus macauensis ZFHKF-1]
MYCNSCGQKNEPGMNYCRHDGAALQPTAKDSLGTFVASDSKFCPSCGHENKQHLNYCSSCAASLYKPVLDRKLSVVKHTERTPREHSGKLPVIGTLLETVTSWKKLKYILISAASAIVIMFLLSFIVNGVMGQVLDNLSQDPKFADLNAKKSIEKLSQQFGDTVDTSDLPERLLGLTDWIMAEHFTSLNYSYSIDTSKAGISKLFDINIYADAGLLLFLFIPFLALVVGGYLYARFNRNDTLGQRFAASVVIGLIYGITVFITSFFTGYSLTFSFSKVTMKVEMLYSHWTAFSHAFVMGIFLSFIGMLLGFGLTRITKHLVSRMPFGIAIHQASATLVRGTLIMIPMTILLVVLSRVFSDSSSSSDGGPTDGSSIIIVVFSMVVLLIQCAFYYWNLENLSSFSLTFHMGKKSEESSLSLFTGITNFNGDSGFASTNNSDVVLYIFMYAGILIPIGLFLYAGWKLYQSKHNFYLTLAIYSVTYAVLMTIFASITRITATLDGSMISMLKVSDESPEMSLGFSLWSTFFLSLLFSAVVTFLGALLAKKRRKAI